MRNFFPDGFQNRNQPLLVTLSADAQRGAVVGEVVAVDADQFGKAQPAGVEEQHDERIALGEELLRLGFAFADDAAHAAFGDEGREVLRALERPDRPHDVVLDGARAEQPAEERAQRRDFAVHRRGVQAGRVGAVENPVAHLLGGDLLHVDAVGIVVSQPAEEPLDVAPVVAHRERRVAPFGLEVAYEIRQHTAKITEKSVSLRQGRSKT